MRLIGEPGLHLPFVDGIEPENRQDPSEMVAQLYHASHEFVVTDNHGHGKTHYIQGHSQNRLCEYYEASFAVLEAITPTQ